mmetsp:Transcript_11672/g.49919  ORF Transcript_11672/g.49919 Transcript_11672/m.49919 type:complete len:248 (-) Transcript_11672:337-1080(-)
MTNRLLSLVRRRARSEAVTSRSCPTGWPCKVARSTRSSSEEAFCRGFPEESASDSESESDAISGSSGKPSLSGYRRLVSRAHRPASRAAFVSASSARPSAVALSFTARASSARKHDASSLARASDASALARFSSASANFFSPAASSSLVRSAVARCSAARAAASASASRRRVATSSLEAVPTLRRMDASAAALCAAAMRRSISADAAVADAASPRAARIPSRVSSSRRSRSFLRSTASVSLPCKSAF